MKPGKFLQLAFISLLFSIPARSQTYLKSKEALVISFQTVNGKKLTLAVDTTNKYLVYRYGTGKHIELEYPNNLRNSYNKFKYFHYSRGGGPQNDGEEIYQLHFTIDNFTYKIYDDWHAVGWQYETGLIIENNKTHKKTIIKRKIKTKKGGLSYLNENDILPYTDEEF